MHNVGQIIKQKREELGLTQEQLAQMVGYKSRVSINKIELQRDVPVKKLKPIADALGIDIRFLININAYDEQTISEITSARLKSALQQKGYSQQDIAELSGVGKASISQYMNGLHAPGYDSAKKMARYLGVSPEYLMGYGKYDDNAEVDYCYEILKNDPDALEHVRKILEMDKRKRETIYNVIDLM